MRTFACTIGTALLTLAATATAQPGRPSLAAGPGPRPASVSPILATADFLLAHTGDLALSDAQVVRLAAISRRVDTRRKAAAESMQMRDQQRADVRDAIAVLTADQQASAWLLVTNRGPLGGGPTGFGVVGPGGPREDAAGPPDRGPIGRPPAARDVPRRPPGSEQVTP